MKRPTLPSIGVLALLYAATSSVAGRAEVRGAGDAEGGVVVPPGNLGVSGAVQFIRRQLLLHHEGESDAGQDLNGDGDLLDAVPRLLDLRTGRSVVLPVAVASPFGVWEQWFAFGVREEEQGQDLNGDGDLDDRVPHVFRIGSPAPVNVGVALANGNARLDHGKLVIPVSEAAQGDTDLNGDGDATDTVVHWLGLSSGSLHDTGLSAGGGLFGVRFDARTLAVRVSESQQGQADLNGSGFVAGDVLHVVDVRTGAVTNTGLSSIGPLFQLVAGRVVLGVSEGLQGADLDGDGVEGFAPVLHLVTRGGVVSNTGQAADPFSSSVVHGRWIYYRAEDGALARLSLVTGVVEHLGLAAELLVFSQGRGALLVDESSADLNGDGDLFDLVLHAFDPLTGVATNLALATFAPSPSSATPGFSLERDVIALRLPENGQDVRDRNLDGDTSDTTLVVRRLDSGTTHHVLLAVSSALAGRRHVVFTVGEGPQGATDRNGDGDALDDVLHVLDLRTGALMNLGAAVDVSLFGQDYDLVGERLLFLVDEHAQGGLDLDGDGDGEDRVAHLIQL